MPIPKTKIVPDPKGFLVLYLMDGDEIEGGVFDTYAKAYAQAGQYQLVA